VEASKMNANHMVSQDNVSVLSAMLYRMRCTEWWYFQWLWRTPNQFSRSRDFWSCISQKRCVFSRSTLRVSVVLATATWLAVCHTPVLYQYR